MGTFISISLFACRSGGSPEQNSDALGMDAIDAANGTNAANASIQSLTVVMNAAGFKPFGWGYFIAANAVNSNAPVRDCIAPAASNGGVLKVGMIDRFKGLFRSCEMFIVWARHSNTNIRRFSSTSNLCATDMGYKNPIGLTKCPSSGNDPEAKYTWNWDNHSRYKAIMSDRGHNPLCWDRGMSDNIMRLWNCKWDVFRGDNQTWLFHGKMDDGSGRAKDLMQK